MALLALGIWFFLIRGPGATPEEESHPVTRVTPAASSAPAPTADPASAAERTQERREALLEPDFRPRAPNDVFEAQIALSRDAICPGSIDGAWGGKTQAAVTAFQQKHGLRVTGQLNPETQLRLQLQYPPLTVYQVTADDFARLRPTAKGWEAKSELDRLDYATVLELVAEKHYCSPNTARRLNAGVDWRNITVGTEVVVPNVRRSPPTSSASFVVIHLEAKTLEVFDENSRLLAHFPCSIARRIEKRPVGRLLIEKVAKNPNYTFDPENFPDSAEAQAIGRKLVLQPGPNNPVGTAWITLNLSGYGIHGTPEPETVGRPESSGCFRLANWNANYVLSLVRIGMPVQIEE